MGKNGQGGRPQKVFIMNFAELKEGVLNFLKLHIFNPKWRCNWCGKEIFTQEFFCEECLEKLPFIDKAFCSHCGRELKVSANSCLSCKGIMTSIDMSRSVFSYKEPISKLIKDLKYFNKRYLVELFGKYLENEYYKNYINADYLIYVPMFKSSQRQRGFNQSQLLAEELSKRINVPVINPIIKVKSHVRQAKLGRKERLNNLKGSFKIVDKRVIKDKVILILDDVITTGATSQVIGELLKKNGAKTVCLLTIASVPNKLGY